MEPNPTSIEKLRQAEARLQSIIDYNITGICFADAEGTITEANDVFLKTFGFTRDDISNGKLNWRAMTRPQHRHLDDQALEKLKSAGVCAPFDKECHRKDGSCTSVLFSAAFVSDSHSEMVCFSFDLSEYKFAQARVNYFAYHDALTNLPNHTLFKDRLEKALAFTRRNEQILAVMLVNVDRFKTINDTLGYVTADQLLREVGERIVGCVRESDTVSRLGGDEFALLLTQVNRAEDAAKIAQNIREALSAPFRFHDQELFVTTSIGISLYPSDAKDTVSLLKSAGTALHRAKEQDGNNYQFYTSGRTTTALRQLVLENNMRPGLERDEFVIYYQPQVNLQSCRLVGIEALVRWQHPGLGLLYPAEFIPIAEKSALIAAIGNWTLRNACLQSKAWRDAGFDPLRIGVNVSARQFQQPNLIESIARVLEETDLEPYLLDLELTEGSIMRDPEQAITKLHELKSMGVQISIDDFGTGYSSLNYLKRFPIDTLKIDKSFVTEINSDPEDAAIVNSIITLAHALKLNVIAEGVETEEQLEYLRALGCDEVQGFLFSKALSVDELTKLLAERRRVGAPKNCDTTKLPGLASIVEQTR